MAGCCCWRRQISRDFKATGNTILMKPSSAANTQLSWSPCSNERSQAGQALKPKRG
jgi:hypothetical protein